MTPLLLEPDPPNCASGGLAPGLDVLEKDPMNEGKENVRFPAQCDRLTLRCVFTASTVVDNQYRCFISVGNVLQVDAYGTPVPELSLDSEQPGMPSSVTPSDSETPLLL